MTRTETRGMGMEYPILLYPHHDHDDVINSDGDRSERFGAQIVYSRAEERFGRQSRIRGRTHEIQFNFNSSQSSLILSALVSVCLM
jgi:hypothetical protein